MNFAAVSPPRIFLALAGSHIDQHVTTPGLELRTVRGCLEGLPVDHEADDDKGDEQVEHDPEVSVA